MKHIKIVSLVLALCLHALLISACMHDQVQTDDIKPVKMSSVPREGRMLTDYQALRVHFDFSSLVVNDEDLYDYIINVLIPPAKNYLYQTLKVPSTTDKFGLPGVSTICSGAITVPTLYQTEGVDADLVIFVTAAYESSAQYVAYSLICLVDSDTGRPVGGRLHFNTAQIQQKFKESQREADLVTTLHEITHILGFSQSVYNQYINPTTGAILTGQRFDITVNGLTVPVLNVEPLTTKLKAYFGCNTLQGAYLENDGSSGSLGSHFERRIFYNEYMTASRLNDARITEFSLALLEGSGWYQVNYTMAEPMTWGKGKGCTFTDGPCVNTAVTPRVAKFSEFCSPLFERGCSWTGREGSMCGNFGLATSIYLTSPNNWWSNNTIVADSYVDNCPVYQPFSNTDCEDVANIATPKIGGSAWGFGSKCFMGTISTSGSPRPFGSYCFRPTCVTSGANKQINVDIAGTIVTCFSEGYLGVPGYAGAILCPDPETFCNVIENEGHCRRKCMGRGTCEGECQCQDGWGSFDCGLRVYSTCSRCDPNSDLPHCYGDACGCDPDDSKCQGLPIGVIIAIAVGGAIFLIAVILTIKYRKAIMNKLKGKKPAPRQAPAPAPAASRGAPPSLQPNNIQTRTVVSKVRRVNAPSNVSIQPKQNGEENYNSSSSLASPNTIRNVRLDFVDSRSGTMHIQTSPMREFMSDRDRAFELISPKGNNNTIKEQSNDGGSKPSSLKRLQSQKSQTLGNGSQPHIASPKLKNNVVIEEVEEVSKPSSKPTSLKRLQSQKSQTLGGSQQNVK